MLKRMLLIAHRGYSSAAPENTFAAFDLALKLGYKDIEFDVQLSSDGVPVIIHDETLERTTNGTGNVADATYAQLSQLDAGSWFDESFADQRIPSLEEFLSRYRARANLHMEIKSTEPELPAKIADLMKASGWTDDGAKQLPVIAVWYPKIVISSFDRDQLARSIEVMPKFIIHELLVEKVSDESLRWAAEHGVRSYHPDGKDITPELIKKAKKLGLHVGAWWESREAQAAQPIARLGVRYAYVDAPHLHRRRSPISYRHEFLLRHK